VAGQRLTGWIVNWLEPDRLHWRRRGNKRSILSWGFFGFNHVIRWRHYCRHVGGWRHYRDRCLCGFCIVLCLFIPLSRNLLFKLGNVGRGTQVILLLLVLLLLVGVLVFLVFFD